MYQKGSTPQSKCTLLLALGYFPVCAANSQYMRLFHLETGFTLVLICWKCSLCLCYLRLIIDCGLLDHNIFEKLRYCFYQKCTLETWEAKVILYSVQAIYLSPGHKIKQKDCFLSERLSYVFAKYSHQAVSLLLGDISTSTLNKDNLITCMLWLSVSLETAQ